MKKVAAAAAAASLAVLLAACGGGSSASSTDGAAAGDIIRTSNGEPQNGLVPTNTSETEGGAVVDMLYSGLMYYDADGESHYEVAESIETDDNQHYTVKLNDGWTFTDGTPVTSSSFVDAWNFGALSTNAQNQGWFFEPIEGYDEVAAETPTAETMTGLQVVDDQTFTITLKQKDSAFEARLGFTAYYPLPAVAYDDIVAFGENPIGNGPYMMDGEGAWQHNLKISTVANPDYNGPRKPANGGIEFIAYNNEDTAYTDLLAGNLDLLDSIPLSAYGTYESDLPGRNTVAPAAINQTFTIPYYLEHFGAGEEGMLRREAISKAFDRQELIDKIFDGTRIATVDFTAPVLPGWRDDLKGADNLKYDPEGAKALWAKANEISPWPEDLAFQIAYNGDASHKDWVDAVTNQIKNTLGIEAHGKEYPTFAMFRQDVQNGTMDTAFRSGWQGDYPHQYGFLSDQYATGAGSNDGKYNSPEFDGLLRQSAEAVDPAQAQSYLDQANEVLLRDIPSVPMWYGTVMGGWAEGVGNVQFGWNGVPLLYAVTK
jgi:oligopeptide transport system substrate-binding protein